MPQDNTEEVKKEEEQQPSDNQGNQGEQPYTGTEPPPDKPPHQG